MGGPKQEDLTFRIVRNHICINSRSNFVSLSDNQDVILEGFLFRPEAHQTRFSNLLAFVTYSSFLLAGVFVELGS